MEQTLSKRYCGQYLCDPSQENIYTTRCHVRLYTGTSSFPYAGRAVILSIEAGEEVYVTAVAGSTLRAGNGATSFMGILLYTS